MNPVKASEAAKCPKVSYVGNFNSIGTGVLVDGEVYRSGGNGWYYPAESVAHVVDGGEAYMQALARGPLKTAQAIKAAAGY